MDILKWIVIRRAGHTQADIKCSSPLCYTAASSLFTKPGLFCSDALCLNPSLTHSSGKTSFTNGLALNVCSSLKPILPTVLKGLINLQTSAHARGETSWWTSAELEVPEYTPNNICVFFCARLCINVNFYRSTTTVKSILKVFFRLYWSKRVCVVKKQGTITAGVGG